MKKIIFILVSFLINKTGFAVCDSGKIKFESNEYSFCNNANTWISMKSNAVDFCSAPLAGKKKYASNIYQFCDGSLWYSMKGNVLSSCLGSEAGKMTYATNIMKFCDGTNWYNMTGVQCSSLNTYNAPQFASLVYYWPITGSGNITNGASIPVNIGSNSITASMPANPPYSYGLGKVDNSLDVKTATNILNLGDPSELQDFTTVTFSGWIKLNSNAAGMIFRKDDNNGYRGEWLDINSGSGKIGLAVVYGSGNTRRYTNQIPANGTWFHFVVTNDISLGHLGIRIYINGVEVTTYLVNATGGGGHSSDVGLNAYIGSSNGTGFLDGSLDEFAVWRTILTPAEVASLYSVYSGCL